MKSNNFQYFKTGIFIFLYCFLTEIGFCQMFFKKEYLCSFSGTKNLPGKICETSDGGFAMLVNTNDINGGFIMKTDHSGHIDYIKQYNLLPFVGNELHDMMFLPDTSLLFIGTFKSNGSNEFPILVKFSLGHIAVILLKSGSTAREEICVVLAVICICLFPEATGVVEAIDNVPDPKSLVQQVGKIVPVAYESKFSYK